MLEPGSEFGYFLPIGSLDIGPAVWPRVVMQLVWSVAADVSGVRLEHVRAASKKRRASSSWSRWISYNLVWQPLAGVAPARCVPLHQTRAAQCPSTRGKAELESDRCFDARRQSLEYPREPRVVPA